MSKEKVLPTQYHIEVYEGSFRNDPFWEVESSTPFPAMSAGEVFFAGGLDAALYDKPNDNQVFKIKELRHMFWVIEGSHIGHKLMVCIELSEKNLKD